MKEILTKILKILVKESESSAEVAADVRALKMVVSAMGPEIQSALDWQRNVQRGRGPSHPDMHKMWLDRLQEDVSKMGKLETPELYTTQGGAD